ncbi:MAG: fatty acid desaturase [Bacteriovoracaceae bacterium]|nr:fatty acid desaturase [Bacteriovoracaceae bacterium]
METSFESPILEQLSLKTAEPQTAHFMDEKSPELMSIPDYKKILMGSLPKEIFQRNPWRLFWIPCNIFIYSFTVFLIINFDLPIIFKFGLSLLLGTLTTNFAFLAHEASHGSIIKSKNLQDLIVFFGLGPYLTTPTYWRYNHNKLHHGHTQLVYKDPDAFPTKMIWKKSKFMKAIFPWTPGSGHKRSFFYFFFWFPFQAITNQLFFCFQNKYYDSMNKPRMLTEFTLQLAMLSTYIYFVGSQDWIFLVLIPFAVQNSIPMSYISTNHNLCPYTKTNDPLVNTVSVTNHPILEVLHLNFGYHAVHHLFPALPMNNAKIVDKKLRELFPEKYMIMPKWKAVKMLYQTPRIYKNADTLVNPKCGTEKKTISCVAEMKQYL